MDTFNLDGQSNLSKHILSTAIIVRHPISNVRTTPPPGLFACNYTEVRITNPHTPHPRRKAFDATCLVRILLPDIDLSIHQFAAMVRRLLVPIVFAAASCTPACGFTPCSTLARMRLDLEFAPALPSTDQSPVKTEENLRSLPPVIQQIADERREFQMNLGKAMDTLRKDMPYILKRSPGKTWL